MGILKGIINAFGGDIATSIGKVIETKEMSAVEKDRLKVDLLVAVNAAKERALEAGEAAEKEATERHKTDMASDSWLSKNIRPLSLAFVTFVVVLLAFCTLFWAEELNIEVLKVWIGLFTGLLLLMYSFYFGSRALEKILTIVAKIMTFKKG